MPLCLLYTLFSDVSVQIFCALFIWVVCFLVLFVFRIQEFNLTQREVWLFPQLLVVSKPLEKVSLLNWRHWADQTTTTQFRVEALSHINNEI